jgi:isopentenyldiphosphate isomerase
LLLNEHGELIIQKRAKTKNHNPNLLDKSIGGHVQYGDSPNLTAMIETIQELQTPSIVLENRADFERTLDVLRAYTATTAVMQYIETIDFISSKYIQNKLISL